MKKRKELNVKLHFWVGKQRHYSALAIQFLIERTNELYYKWADVDKMKYFLNIDNVCMIEDKVLSFS